MKRSTFENHVLTNDTIVLCPGDRLDNTNAHLMVEAIVKAQDAGHRFIIIDMSELEFLSSAGVGSFVGTVETSRLAGGDIVLCNLSQNIRHVFEVLDLAEFMTITPDREAAAAVCAARSQK